MQPRIERNGETVKRVYIDREVFSWNLVAITRRTHLYPYRTQKLSPGVPMILGG